jgi:hypothetical protein
MAARADELRGGRVAGAARLALSAIRLVNGSVALTAPSAFARKAGVDPETNASALYVLRLFGIRTVLLGADLLARDPASRARALRAAPLVHVSDVVAAALAGAGRQVPAKAARTAVLVSTVNVALALIARRGASRPS